MKGYEKTRINTFFVEIIIVLLFFSISATVIVEVFAATNHEVQTDSIKSDAIDNAYSIISVYKQENDIALTLRKIFGEDVIIRTDNAGRYLINLNRDLAYEDEENNVKLEIYETIDAKKAGTIKNLDMKYSYYGQIVYEAQSSTYFTGE